MYEPGRKDGYEYIWELMHDIEENQCRTCIFSKLQGGYDPSFAEDYPMCGQVEGTIIQEIPVPDLDWTPDRGVVCTSYRNVEIAQEAHPDQSELF